MLFVLGHTLGHELMEHDRKAVHRNIMLRAMFRLGTLFFLPCCYAIKLGVKTRPSLPASMAGSLLLIVWYAIEDSMAGPQWQPQADEMGLMLMTLAGYDPGEVTRFASALPHCDCHVPTDRGPLRRTVYSLQGFFHIDVSFCCIVAVVHIDCHHVEQTPYA